MSNSLTIDGGVYDVTAAWRCASKDEWRGLLASFKREFPEAEYDGDHKVWRLPRSGYHALRTWAGRYFAPEEIHDWARGSQGAPPSPHPTVPRSPLERAYASLCLLPQAPPELVSAALRILAKSAHPDKGGAHEPMVALTRAAEFIREHQRVGQ